MKKWWLILICQLGVFTGCGYRMVGPTTAHSLSIPYVEKDTSGRLTMELVSACAQANGLSVSRSSQFELIVHVVTDANTAIGYRQDPQEIEDVVQPHLTQNEERRTLTVDVSVLDKVRGCPILGPIRFIASVDYDYVDGDSLPDLEFLSSTGMKKTLAFSLGQLDSKEAANDAAMQTLCRKISHQIAETLQARWP